MQNTSAESKLELDLELLLPGLADEKDQCIKRLEQTLTATRGIQKVHVELHATKSVLCLHYDPGVYNLTSLRRTAERSGAEIANRYQHAMLAISGMDCADCVIAIEHGLSRMEGVLSVAVSYVTGSLRVEFDTEKTNLTQIEKKLKALGYPVSEKDSAGTSEERRELMFSLLCGASLAAAWCTIQFSLPTSVTHVLFLSAYFFGGYDVTRHSLQSLRSRQLDTDVLMLCAALGAAALGEFMEGGLLLFLFSLGHALEEMALDKARDAISKLGQLTPKTAIVLRDSNQVEIPVADLRIGEVVVVRPGVRLPVDGVISLGQSSVDQSPITGESVPIEKSKGDMVFAGSINGNSQLLVKTTKLAKDNTLSRVMQLVEESQTQKTKTQQITEKFTKWFVPAVLIVDVLLVVSSPLFGVSLSSGFLHAMTFLVAVSPCALALAAPSAMLSGIAQAARNGVLIKGGLHLETLGSLTAVAFDKTGTLTHGKPQVTDILEFGGMSQSKLLTLVAACESRSGHPLAGAIVADAQAKGLELPVPDHLRSVSGQGLVASVQGHTVVVGNHKLMKQQSIKVSSDQLKQQTDLEAEGKTAIFAGVDGILEGAIGLADTPRSNAKAALDKLRTLGIQEIVLLSGDNILVAESMARSLGINEVKADLMPEDKLKAIRSVAEARIVAMVGDGINDAPALAAASVGIAMGGASTDVALETADVALMGDDLSKLPFVVSLGRATRNVVRQNLFISILTILALSVTSVLGLSNIGWAILFHEGSTMLVVLNSLRLLSHRAHG